MSAPNVQRALVERAMRALLRLEARFGTAALEAAIGELHGSTDGYAARARGARTQPGDDERLLRFMREAGQLAWRPLPSASPVPPRAAAPRPPWMRAA